MIKAGFDWGYTDGVVWIIDQNNGKMSVTNDIENVVDDLIGRSKPGSFLDRIQASDVFVYRDSEGQWDGWDHIKKAFIPLIAYTRTEATTKALIIKNKLSL